MYNGSDLQVRRSLRRVSDGIAEHGPLDDDERRFWLTRLKAFAKMKLEGGDKDQGNRSGGGRGRGRGRGRGGRGGRGGGRGGHGGGRGGSNQRGEKRKREDDGNENAASKGKPPSIATKKQKVDE